MSSIATKLAFGAAKSTANGWVGSAKKGLGLEEEQESWFGKRKVVAISLVICK
jgi:hypothetical protein